MDGDFGDGLFGIRRARVEHIGITERDGPGSIFRGQAGLFAEFVRSDALKLPMALDWNRLLAIGVDGVIGAFAE